MRDTSPFSRLPAWIGLGLALAAGLVLFVNYFFPLALLNAPAQFLLKTGMLTSAGALLLILVQLVRRHGPQARQRQPGSILLLTGFGIMFGAGLLSGRFDTGVEGWLYQWALAPGMAAIFALLPIFLIFALTRRLRIRDLGGFLFFLGMVFVLLGQMPGLSRVTPFFAATRHDIFIAPAAAAFRGVLLGLALGGILAILRRARWPG
jgi:hypothetical protein